LSPSEECCSDTIHKSLKSSVVVVRVNADDYFTGTIGGILAMRYWLDTFSTGYIDPKTNLRGISSTQSSEIVSLLSAGTFFGALSAGPLADWVGRKFGLMISTVVFTVGVILQTAATDIPLFVAGRFFAGFGVGLISAQVISAHIPLHQTKVDFLPRYRSTNRKQHPNGFAVLSWALIN